MTSQGDEKKKKRRYVAFLLIVVSLVSIFSTINYSFAQEKLIECEKEYHEHIAVPKCLMVDMTEQDNIFISKNFTTTNGTIIIDFNNTMIKKTLSYKEEAPHNWWTGITLVRIGEINTVEGTYEMRFNHWVQVFEHNDIMTKFNETEPGFDYVYSVGEPIKTKSKGIIQKKGLL